MRHQPVPFDPESPTLPVPSESDASVDQKAEGFNSLSFDLEPHIGEAEPPSESQTPTRGENLFHGKTPLAPGESGPRRKGEDPYQRSELFREAKQEIADFLYSDMFREHLDLGVPVRVIEVVHAFHTVRQGKPGYEGERQELIGLVEERTQARLPEKFSQAEVDMTLTELMDAVSDPFFCYGLWRVVAGAAA